MGIINCGAKTSAKAKGHFHVCILDSGSAQDRVSGRERERARRTKIETTEKKGSGGGGLEEGETTVKTQMTYLAGRFA